MAALVAEAEEVAAAIAEAEEMAATIAEGVAAATAQADLGQQPRQRRWQQQ